MQDENPGSTIPEGLPVWVNDSHEQWSKLRIAQTVPLGRLEWKWRSRGALVRDSSTSVRVSFHVSNSISNPIPALKENPCDWFRNPYVFIYVTCTTELNHINEDTSSGWRRIRDYVDLCRERNYEYLFILAASETDVATHKGAVEKLRNEVNLVSRGPQRLLVLAPVFSPQHAKPIAHLHHSPVHQELLQKLRDFLRTGVDARIMAYDDVITRSYLSRSNVSWSFSKFYVLKEGLVFVFLHLGRRDLCLKLYDELQKVMNDLDKADISRFCDQPAAEIALGATNPEAKDYRSIALKGTVTELDLRTYLFARQVTLLLHDRKFSEIAERGLKFITVVARRCAEEALNGNGEVSGVFRDTWVFVTARLLSSILAPSIPTLTEAEHSLTAQLATPRERHTARLVAGFHVNALKAFQGLAHVVLPGCLSPTSSEKNSKEVEKLAAEAMATSSLKLRNALSSPENAQVLHSEIANAAASLYEMGGRARGAAALDGDAGIVRLKNKSYAEAETLLSAQCSRYTNDNGWDDLHRRQRVELAKVEKALDKVQEYLVSCLSILYMHRESRVISHRPIFQEAEVTLKQMEFWASETKRAASLLPRVMKYKAERLFDVSVLPNRRKWYEGDHGTATVRIKSDIPVSICVDIVMLECRFVDIRENKRPSLRSRDLDELDHHVSEDPSLSTAERGTIPTESSSWSSELSDVVMLKSSGETLLKPGVNDVTVSVDEIPRPGCYKVTVVSLFLGNLKLVHAATKGQSQQIVTVKGDDSPTHASMTIPISEVIDGEVKFPPLFAAPRLPSASLELVQVPRLFLLGNSLQYLQLKVKAGVNGVREGSNLCCTLQEISRRRPHSKSIFVQFADKAVATSSRMKRNVSITTHRQPGETGEILGVDILSALEPEEELYLRFGLQQLIYQDSHEERLEDVRERVRKCVLHAAYVCNESEDQKHRTYSCRVEVPLVFVPILDISARLETRSEYYEKDGSRAISHDENAEESGTLLCSAQSLLGWDEEACITKVSLDTPQWLERRGEDATVQSKLIPSVLRGSSVFVCSFDLFVRDFLVVEDDDLDTTEKSVEDPSLRKGLLQRRLSRKVFKSPDISESQDDFGDWKADGSQISVKKDTTSIEGHDLGDITNKDDKQTGSSHSSNELEKVEQASHGSLSTEENFELKEARDVVDLSTPGEESHGEASGMLTPPIPPQGLPMSATTATLRLDLKINGVDGDAYIEQKISLAALRVIRKRYKIERRICSEAESGKPMSLAFAVLGVFGRFSGEDEKHEVVALHYEIDADPSVWLVVGRRRGQMMISDVAMGKGSTTMIPLRCGRHRVPCLRLYTSDGRGLPLSTYENVDEYMQIVIRPCRAVVSCCIAKKSGGAEVEQKRDGNGSRGTMPEVVASDSFFES